MAQYIHIYIYDDNIMHICRCALSVLINVTKDKAHAAALAHNGDTTDLLVDLMQMFRDKKDIFGLSCELLGRLVTSQDDIKVCMYVR